MVNNIIKIPVFQPQLLQLPLEGLNFFCCQWIFNARTPVRSRPGWDGAANLRLFTACMALPNIPYIVAFAIKGSDQGVFFTVVSVSNGEVGDLRIPQSI